MADGYEGEIKITIDGRDAVQDGNRISRVLDDIERNGREASSSTEKLGKSFGGLKGQIAALVGGVSIAAFLKDTISVTKEFQSSISELSAITGATGDDLAYLSDSARELGASTTLSASQVATAFKLVASAKPDLLESKEALKAVTKETITLAEAAGIELPEAASVLAASLNQFGASADQASDYINVIAAGSKFGAASIAEMGEALRAAGTTAAASGLSFEETNAALQSLSTVAIKGSQAGTQLRNVILRLQKEGVEELDPSVVGLSTALKNLGEENRSTTELMELFGAESVNAAQALMNQADNIESLTTKLTDTNVAYEQAVTMTDNLEGDQKRLASSFQEVQLILGTQLNPHIRTFVQWVTGLIDDIPTLITNMELFGVAMLQTFAVGMAHVKTGFSALWEYIKGGADIAAAAMMTPIRNAILEIADLLNTISNLDNVLIGGDTKRSLHETSVSLAIMAIRIGTVDDATERLNGNIQRLNIARDEEIKALEETASEMADEIIARKELAEGAADHETTLNKLNNVIKDNTSATKDNNNSTEISKDLLSEVDQVISRLLTPAEIYAKTVERLNFLNKNAGLSAEFLARGLKQAEEEFESAGKAADKLADKADPFEVTWNRAIERLDNGFADLWKSALDGEIKALDFMKEIAKDWLAEMIHMFTTKKIVANFSAVGSSMMAGASGATETAGGVSSANNVSMLGSISNLATGHGLYEGIAGGVNALGNMTPYGNIMASNTGGFAMSNMGLGLSGLAGGFIGGMVSDGPYAGIGGSIGGIGGSLAATTIASGSGMAMGAAMGSIVPVVGTIVGAVLGGLLAGSFGGNADETPDTTIWTGKNTKSKTLWQSENDISFQAAGVYGNVGVMTQHDAFKSDADAEAFADNVKTTLMALDTAIFEAVDEGTNAAINAVMGKNWDTLIKYEEGGDVNNILRKRFDRIFSAMDNSMENFYESLRDGGMEYNKAAAVVTSLAIALKDTNTSLETAHAIFEKMDATADELTENLDLFVGSLAVLANYAGEDLVEAFGDFNEQQAIANETLYQSYQRNLGKINELATDFDWSIESLAEMGSLIEANRLMEIALLEQIEQLSSQVNAYISGIIAEEDYGYLSEGEKQKYNIQAANDSYIGLSSSTDPEETARLAGMAASYVMAQYGLVNDDPTTKDINEKQQYWETFAKPALNLIQDKADERFELAKDGVIEVADQIKAVITEAFSEITKEFQQAAKDMNTAASNMNAAATNMNTAAKKIPSTFYIEQFNTLSELMY